MANYRPVWWFLLAANLAAFVVILIEQPQTKSAEIVLVTSLVSAIVFGLLLSGRFLQKRD
jgi:predicted branched-subunit amino acid permease